MADMDLVYSAQGHDESVSATTLTPSNRLGMERIFLGEKYVYCYNSGGGAIDKLDGVKLITACSGFSVAATSLTDVVNPFIGVAKNATVAAGAYFWAMTRGFCNVNVVSATTGDYVALALGANGSFIQHAAGTSVVGTAALAGYAQNANTGAGGLVYTFIRSGI